MQFLFTIVCTWQENCTFKCYRKFWTLRDWFLAVLASWRRLQRTAHLFGLNCNFFSLRHLEKKILINRMHLHYNRSVLPWIMPVTCRFYIIGGNLNRLFLLSLFVARRKSGSHGRLHQVPSDCACNGNRPSSGRERIYFGALFFTLPKMDISNDRVKIWLTVYKNGSSDHSEIPKSEHKCSWVCKYSFLWRAAEILHVLIWSDQCLGPVGQ